MSTPAVNNGGPVTPDDSAEKMNGNAAIDQSFDQIGPRDPAEYTREDLQTVIAHMQLLLKDNPELKNSPVFMNTLNSLRSLETRWSDNAGSSGIDDLRNEYRSKEEFLAILVNASPQTPGAMDALGDLEDINREFDFLSAYLNDRDYTSETTALEDAKRVLLSLERLEGLGVPATELDHAGLGSKNDMNTTNFSLYASLSEAVAKYEKAIADGLNGQAAFADLRADVAFTKLQYARTYELDASVIKHHEDSVKAEQIADMDAASLYSFLMDGNAPSLSNLTDEGVAEYINAINLALSKCPNTSEFEPVRLVLIQKLVAAENLQQGLSAGESPALLGMVFSEHAGNAEVAYYDYMITLAESTGDADLMGEMETAKQIAEETRNKLLEFFSSFYSERNKAYDQINAKI